MPTNPSPVRFFVKPEASAKEALCESPRQGAMEETAEAEPKKQPPKQIASGSGAYFLTPAPTKQKRP